MKIQTIEITDYKAFLGTYTINVAGKNLFIYGENGSGKSSFYYAFSHNNTEKHEIRTELENAIQAVKSLKSMPYAL